jgi:type II secretion system protein D
MGWLLALFAALFVSFVMAQDPPASAEKKPASDTASTNAPAADAKPTSTDTNSPAASADKGGASTNQDIQVSFQGANIDMIVQWLAQTTGKSVLKHPQAQCQVNIISSKKLPPREALNLVYRAMSLEGVTAVESSTTIMLVPQDKEPKLNPQLLDASRKDIPDGRERLVKLFPLMHAQADDLKDKLRSVLSDKGTLEADDNVNQLIATDYTDNIRLLAQLISEFDVAESGLVLKIYPLAYGDAEEVGNLISLIMNLQPGTPSSAGRSSSSSSSHGSPMPVGVRMSGGGPMPSGDSGGGGSPPTAAGASGSPGGIRIWPDKTSNRLVVSAPKARLAEFERLLLVLDAEKTADVTVRVLPLKNIQAVDLVKDIGPLYQRAGGGKTGKEMIEVAASDRSNSLIILSSEANFRGIEKLVASLDTEGAQEKAVQTFPLKNADAQDVAKQLQDLSRDQNNDNYPYRIFYFGGGSGEKNTKKMSVVADRRRNSLIVQAPPAQMESIAKMIEELDAPVGDDSLAPKIYHLKYISAVDIEEVLNELFLKKTQQRPYYFDYFDQSSESQPDRDVGRLYGKVRITSEPYSNTLIVTSNSKESLAVLENMIQELDAPSEAGETTLRVQLKFAKAPIVANNINILFAKNGSPFLQQRNPQQQQQQLQNNAQQQQQQQNSSYQVSFAMGQEAKEEGYYPWLGGPPDPPRSSDGRSTVRPVSDLVGRVRAVPDQRSNSLMISANVHFFPQIMKLVEEMDAPTAQVLIEARIVEISADYLDKLGVRWAPSGSQIFSKPDDYDNSILAQNNVNYQQGFGGTTTVNGPPSLGSALTQMRSGVLNATINMDFLIQFLRRTTKAKVLAEPQINVADNELGQLFVGQQVPFISYSQSFDTGSLNNTFQYKDVGVVLEVTPHINKNGDVALKIRTESSSIVPGQVILGGAVIDTREFRTDLKAKTGETLVLGGIIQKQISDTLRKTPILGDIPVIKWLFNKKDKSSLDVELMVFLRPKITRTPEEARELLEDIYKKAPDVKDWEEGKPDSKPGKPTKKNEKPAEKESDAG